MSLTLPEPPTWMQNRTYSARLDRQIVQLLFSEGVLDIGSNQLEVRETGGLPTNAIEVVAGVGIVTGDDEPIQGHYVSHVGAGGAAFVSFAMPPAPVTDQRVDLIVLRVNDSTSGSTETPADAAVLDVVQGATGVGPTAPALPPTAIPLAEVLRTAGDTFVDNGMITDLRVQATQAQYTTFSRFEVLTSVERDALVSPAVGRTIFNTTTNRVETFDGVAFVGTGVFAVTTVERDALTGLFPGYTVLNTDTNSIETYDGTDWLSGSFLVVTTAERLALTPFIGQTVYDTDLNQVLTFNGSDWLTAGVQVVDTVGRDALTDYVGLTVYNTDLSQLQTYDGANWLSVGVFAVTTLERDALIPYVGLTVFNSDVSRIQVFDGSVFRDVGETFFAALTTAQRNALTPFVGQVIFNIDTDEVQVYDGAVWQVVAVQTAPSVATLTDVDLSGLVDGDFLQYDNSSGNWLPAQIVIPPPEDPIPLILALS